MIGITVWIGFIVSLFFVSFLIYFVTIFNGLVRLKNDIAKAWANIDVLLKQRSDELPKLIESVRGYMKHEKDVLTDLTKARSSIISAKSMSDRAKADNEITGALKTIFAVSENYPTLKANENFLKLQERITGLENELADRREFFNDAINNYNIRIMSFPDFLVARMLKYTTQEMFKATEEEKKNVNNLLSK